MWRTFILNEGLGRASADYRPLHPIPLAIKCPILLRFYSFRKFSHGLRKVKCLISLSFLAVFEQFAVFAPIGSLSRSRTGPWLVVPSRRSPFHHVPALLFCLLFAPYLAAKQSFALDP